MTQSSCGPTSPVAVIGSSQINEEIAETYMKKYELYDRIDLFPKDVRTMEIKEWESFAKRNPYLAKFYGKKMPGYFFVALETWNSELDFNVSNPFLENIFADTIKYWRNLILNQDEELSNAGKILLENVGIALGSVPSKN